ncbi:DUF2478 domain-containing protein [Paracoccus aminophilus]|uniref:DUF2478 domain-containing protein n=1 Tax=Paracoccus aminophilus JCM 7686 TaxID=1367847 RepID=S5Y7Z1_PARAH|nr:DUF2478 domain-containing protein [Paracoccus aminophilus]AGT07463.1 hypothetical protein JCM7686_0354 [Paracoccus aminophilus JCM 7686]
MLGYISMSGTPGEADLLLTGLAQGLCAEGLRVAGAVQINIDLGPDCACDMDLEVLGDDGPPVRISQSLGSGSEGCRLDAGALETAVARVQRVLDQGAELVILNKFAKQEAFGRGFREVIAAALERGVPVLTYVPEGYEDAFSEFAGDFAEAVSHEAARDWCLGAVRVAAQ